MWLRRLSVMATKERLLELLREGTRVEERVVLSHIDESLRQLGSLRIPQGKKDAIREKLEEMRRETIEHNERFKAAAIEVQEGDKDDY